MTELRLWPFSIFILRGVSSVNFQRLTGADHGQRLIALLHKSISVSYFIDIMMQNLI